MIYSKMVILFLALLLIIFYTISPSYAQELYFDSLNIKNDYLELLYSVDSVTFVHEFEYPFLVLLNEFQSEYYNSLQSLDTKKEYIRFYWNRENPNPLDAENRWLKSFIERQNYTKKYYSFNRPPYYDDRGKYYLKYGKPSSKYVQRGESRSENTSTSFETGTTLLSLNVENTLGTLGQEISIINEVEMWSYENLVNDFVIYFEREMTTFEEVRYPGRLQNERPSRKRSIWWYHLNKMFFYSPYLTRFYVDVQEDIDSGRLDFDVALVKGITIAQSKESIAKVIAPDFAENPEPEERSLHFIDDIFQFRGPEGSTRIETSFLVPIKEIYGDIGPSTADSLSIHYSELLRDMDYNLVNGTHSLRSFPVQSAAREGLEYAMNVISLITPSLTGELTLQIKNNDTGHLGYTKKFINIRSFQDNELMLSDIQLFKEIITADQRFVLPASVKGGFYAAPYPFPEIQKSKPVLLYFEVYNIVEDGSSEEYTLEISVDWDESRENRARKFFDFLTRRNKYSIGRTDTRITNRNTTREAIQFDMSSLRNGPYILSITVSDVSNNNNVTSSKEIILVN